MFVVRAPDRIDTTHGSLDSDVMTTKTVETIMNIFLKSNKNNKVRNTLLEYYTKCIKKNQQISGKWASKK